MVFAVPAEEVGWQADNSTLLWGFCQKKILDIITDILHDDRQSP